jgi:hypothetical protein
MEKRFTVVKTTRVVSLSGLKTLSFPLTELFYEVRLNETARHADAKEEKEEEAVLPSRS